MYGDGNKYLVGSFSVHWHVIYKDAMQHGLQLQVHVDTQTVRLGVDEINVC
jgi:hypothetical protein